MSLMSTHSYYIDPLLIRFTYFIWHASWKMYNYIVWDGCTAFEKRSFERLQFEAARIVAVLARYVSIYTLINEIGQIDGKFNNLLQFTKLRMTFCP